MRFFPAEPDIATVFNRIVDKDIDLQPDFQRGEVWPVTKQQRLIDSILRGWVIPPILIVSAKPGAQQVLDGQQRLASIRDFKLNKFAIDGNIAPADTFIKSLHGLRYQSLPTDVSKAFDRTTLRIYEIADYRPEEPAEIFFRLNQPTVLTAAERRNAFFGPVRHQIRALVETFEASGGGQPVLGFSNSRMAYDDVLARFACTLEQNTLRKKITAAAVNEMYRRPNPLSDEIRWRVEHALQLALKVMTEVAKRVGPEEVRPRLNKATFFSWLLFFARLDATGDPDKLTAFFQHFESVRNGLVLADKENGAHSLLARQPAGSPLVPLLLVYTDRATSRVADVSSVLLRDFALWLAWYEFAGAAAAGCRDPAYNKLSGYRPSVASALSDQQEAEALRFIDEIGWGGSL